MAVTMALHLVQWRVSPMVRMKARLRARHLGYLMVVQKAVRLAQTKVGSRVVSMAVRLVPTTAVMTAEKKAAMTASTMAVMTAAKMA